MMYDVALRIVKNPEIAEDVVADTFLVLITKINAVIEHEHRICFMDVSVCGLPVVGCVKR